jgi:PBP1b-binding outer membrane lipoprotein LpoB
MKRIILLLAAAAMMCGCTKKEPETSGNAGKALPFKKHKNER